MITWKRRCSDMYLVKTPAWIQKMFTGFTWRINDPKTVYLTFDDGPIPEITPFILDELKKHHAKATFFVVGENVIRYPDIYQRILDEGHSVGNHTHNHLNAWKTSHTSYVENVDLCNQYIQSNLFRPPYGKITPRTYRALKEKYHLVMWDVLAGDFIADLSPQELTKRVVSNSKPGSIVVLHDNLKSAEKLIYALPQILKYYDEQGWSCSYITQGDLQR